MAKTKVLIVDDHADSRLLVSARLKKHRYDTVFAADALQAIAVECAVGGVAECPISDTGLLR